LGFGCNVAAVMGSRVLESEHDRRVTIMVSPFISCSARLPVYVLLAGAFFPPASAGRIIFSLYLLGIVVAVVMARLLRVYVVKGPETPFVMELPPYRLPTLKSAVIHMWTRAVLYVKKAGTIILAMSILMWFLSHYPRVPAPTGASAAEVQREQVEHSLAGIMGRAVAPAFAPIGLDHWQTAVALGAGVVAKEVVVSTLGTLYASGGNEKSAGLRAALRADPFFTPLRAFTLMVFILLYIPCVATIAMARRELNSWAWAAGMMAMNLGVAYLVAGAVFWGGRLLGFN